MKNNFQYLLIIFYLQIAICDIMLPKSGKEVGLFLRIKIFGLAIIMIMIYHG